MELKEFIKEVILDITNAIDELKSELPNDAIIAPTNSNTDQKVNSDVGVLEVSYVDFEVAVTAASTDDTKKSAGGGIKVLAISIGGGTEKGNKELSERISRIKFSIPIVYPSTSVKKRPQTGGKAVLLTP